MPDLWNKFKDALLGADSEDYDDDDDEYEEDDYVSKPYRTDLGFSRSEREPRARGSSSVSTSSSSYSAPSNRPQLVYSNTRTTETSSSNGRAQVRFCRPKSLEEATKLVENTRNEIISIVDLSETERIEPLMCQRIADFLCGAAYALDGDIIRHSDSIFALVPEGADVSSQELVKEIKERSVSFSAVNW